MTNPRRIFLLHRKYQLTTIGMNLGLALIAIVVFYFQNRYLFTKFTQVGPGEEWQVDPMIMELVQQEQARMQMTFGLTALVILLAFLGIGVVLSHRVAGPLYRLQKHMEDIASGREVSEVKFREKDFFPELAETFNRMIRRLKK